MSIKYSWRIEDMKWDNSTGMVVYVNAAYVGTYNGLVGSSTTTITEHKIVSLSLDTSPNPIAIESLTPKDVKGSLDDEFASEILKASKKPKKPIKRKKVAKQVIVKKSKASKSKPKLKSPRAIVGLF